MAKVRLSGSKGCLVDHKLVSGGVRGGFLILEVWSLVGGGGGVAVAGQEKRSCVVAKSQGGK